MTSDHPRVLSLALALAFGLAAGAAAATIAGTDPRLPGAILLDAYLERADLSFAHLTRANLTDAYLGDALLTGADLTHANLTGADLTRADLSGADLTHADLTGADLTRADLTRAVVSRTVIADFNLANTSNLSAAHHIGPSEISISTLELTAAALANNQPRRAEVEAFLRSAGVSETYLEAFRLSIGRPIEGEPLTAALAALMTSRVWDQVEKKLRCFKGIHQELDEREKERFAAELTRAENKEIREMVLARKKALAQKEAGGASGP